MPEYDRRWCRLCGEITTHWYDRAPRHPHPAFVLVWVRVWILWSPIVPWACRECGEHRRPWSRSR